MSKKAVNIFTVIVSCIIGIVITVIVIQHSKYKFLAKITNNLYEDNAIHFQVKSEDTIEPVINQMDSDSVLFCELNSTYKALYFNGNYKLPMKKGRFFAASDFTEDKNYVAIGGNHVKQIYLNGDKEMFSFNGVEFEVIGIIGMDIASPLDNMILFNFKNVKQYMPDDSIYVLSESNKTQKIDNNPDVIIYDVPTRSVNRIFDNKISIYTIMYVCLFLTVYGLIVLLTLHLKNQMQKIKVYGILGFNYNYIALRIFSEQLKYIIIPSAVGTALCFLFTDKYYINLKQIFLLIIINLILMLISVLAIKIKVRDVFRQEGLFGEE